MTDETAAGPTLPICCTCASSHVLVDAWGTWSLSRQAWELSVAFENGYCESCAAETRFFEWVRPQEQRTRRTRVLNDQLRQHVPGPHDRIVMTHAVAAHGEVFVAEVAARLHSFAAFDEANDPHHEHDFGVFSVEGERLYFKIDYYNVALDGHSPDPTDPAVTARVLTIMLAHEY